MFYNDIKAKELSIRANIPYTTILSYVNGKSQPNIENAVRIAQILNVTAEKLVLLVSNI